MPVSPTVLLTSAAALAAVLGLIVLLGRLARRTGLVPSTRGRGQRLSVEEALALDARHRVQIVRCDGRECLVLTGATGGTMLGWLEQAK